MDDNQGEGGTSGPEESTSIIVHPSEHRFSDVCLLPSEAPDIRLRSCENVCDCCDVAVIDLCV